LEVRPIYHQRDDTSIGHTLASFLALRLEVDLAMQQDHKGIETAWPHLMRDLKRLQAVHMNLDDRSYRIRTDFEGVVYQVFKAAGVQPPGRVTMLKSPVNPSPFTRLAPKRLLAYSQNSVLPRLYELMEPTASIQIWIVLAQAFNRISPHRQVSGKI
jgi:hypothetical protein